jgi:membrane protein
MQLSWTICLLGAEIAYAGQNVRNYEFETDSKNISKRYNDFLILVVMTLIVKRFQEEKPPYTADEISIDYKIPIRLTSHILFYLVDLGLINETRDDDQYPNYQPALDINKITIRYLFNKMDSDGSENFFIDKNVKFRNEWLSILKLREDMYATEGEKLLKDL